MSKKLVYLVSVYMVLMAATGVRAETVTVVSDADTWTAGTDTASNDKLEFMAIQGGGSDRTGYVRFDLSTLNILKVESATLTLTVHGAIPKPPYRNDTVNTGRFALYGLNGVAGNTAQNWDPAALNGSNTGGEVDWTTGTVVVAGGRATDLDEDVAGITETVTAAAAGGWALGTTITITGQPLVSFIQSRVDDSGLVTFILKNDDSADRGYGICSREYVDEAYHPKLELAVVTGAKSGATRPNPQDKAADVLRDAVLSWKPAASAATHNVYLGTDLDAVTTAGASVLVGQGQDANTYDPPGHLTLGQTYYWRVDEVNGAPDFTVQSGPVWSFTVEPYSYPIANVTATASSFETNTGPENTVNGSGLDPQDLHSTGDKTMWLSGKTAPLPAWIQYQFDRVYKLHEMWVWNHNTAMESVVGRRIQGRHGGVLRQWHGLARARRARVCPGSIGPTATRTTRPSILPAWRPGSSSSPPRTTGPELPPSMA